jgi:hypothetical protein
MNQARLALLLASGLAAGLLAPPAAARGKEGRKDDRKKDDRKEERKDDRKDASAADSCGPEVTDPQRLAEAGLRLYRDAAGVDDPQARVKEYERALRCYQAAFERSQRQAVKLYHPLGLVYEKLERHVEAVDALRRFLAEVPEAQRNVGVTKQINDKLKALGRFVAELAVDTVPGLPVRVDEQLVGKAPLGRLVVVTPGSHTVTVGDPQQGTLGADVTVEGGQVRRVDLTAWRARGSEPPPQGQAPDAPGAPRVAPAFLTVRSNRAGATVQIDGRVVGRTPLGNLATPPGAHEIRARDGSQQVATTLTLLPQEQRAVTLSFPVKPWVWALVGVGAAAVVGTAVGVGVYYGTSVGKPDGVVSF